MIETQVDINSTTNIFNGTVLGGFLSDDGQYFCAVDGERLQTAFYSISGDEVSTFDGIVTSASGDLTSCLVITDANSGAANISVWDGGTGFFSTGELDFNL